MSVTRIGHNTERMTWIVMQLLPQTPSQKYHLSLPFADPLYVFCFIMILNAGDWMQTTGTIFNPSLRRGPQALS